MILRKPYAFLIKYFKFIHICLVVIMTYLLYRTNILLNFFQEYIGVSQLLTGKDFTGTLFKFNMFLFPFIIIVVLIILLSVMYYKKKPFVYYITHILAYITVLIVYNIAFSTAAILENQIMDIRNVRLVRDLLLMIILIQGVTVVLTFIRATGFDIKKFNFGQDLQELEVTEDDNEEFEVDINIETNVIHRGINKNFRFAKYIYVENRFLINVLFLLSFSTICFILYMNLTIYNRSLNEGTIFDVTEFQMKVNKSYITNQDYRGKEITGNYLVVVELDIRSNFENTVLTTARAELIVNGETYYHTNKYRSHLMDLGQIYYNEVIPISFGKVVLVYEIPASQKNSSLLFQYIDEIQFGRGKLNPKTIKVKLNPFNLDKEPTIKTVNTSETIILNDNVLGKTAININEFNINEYFAVNYTFCITKTECLSSKEYIRPIANSNYDKIILKIDSMFKKDEEINVSKIYDIYTIIKYFGQINYTINGTTKAQNIGFNNLRPSKTEDKENSYIEILDEIEKASEIELVIKVRNNVYKYPIK